MPAYIYGILLEVKREKEKKTFSTLDNESAVLSYLKNAASSDKKTLIDWSEDDANTVTTQNPQAKDRFGKIEA